MGFLKRFFRNVLREGAAPAGASSFQRLGEEELEAHLGVARYGNFLLSDAVRPSYDLQVVPTQGFRHDTYRDEQNRTAVPVLMASVSKELLFDTFMDLLDPLGSVVNVVLETSHNRDSQGHTDLYREHIDVPVLKSVLWEFEDLLVNDGCTGLAVLNPYVPQEVQFDEHKLLIVYGDSSAGLRRGFPPTQRALQRGIEVPHRGRARPFLQRPLRAAVRRTEDAAGHGLRLSARVRTGGSETRPWF